MCASPVQHGAKVQALESFALAACEAAGRVPHVGGVTIAAACTRRHGRKTVCIFQAWFAVRLRPGSASLR